MDKGLGCDGAASSQKYAAEEANSALHELADRFIYLHVGERTGAQPCRVFGHRPWYVRVSARGFLIPRQAAPFY
ncbi:hypothetical protein [Polaromonas sp. UC242_47]|uniref:hypothetical protein n=1 Tax=Polaromonas sp. UC242_47 TaxID=3374626 RepID=UPI0037939032